MLAGALVAGGFAPASAALLDAGVVADRPALAAGADSMLPTAIAPLAVITSECGTSADCARLTITNSVVGGTATASDWTLKAVRNNASADEFAFTSGQMRTVPRNRSNPSTTYTLSATPVDSALGSRYTTTFACEVSNGASRNVDARAVTYAINGGSGPSAGTRNANCTFTHTYQGASVVVDARVLRKESTPADLANPSYLAGMTYRLHEVAGSGTTGNPYRPGAATAFACTIAAAPATSCTIPVEGASALGRSYFVVQVPNGATYTNETLMLGSYSGPTTPFWYAGRTPQLAAGATVSFPQDALGSTGDNTRSAVVSASLANPAISLSCQEGLRIAIQMDLSDSVSATQRTQYRAALLGLVDSLVGTGTQVALFTFGAGSPARTGWQAPTPRSVDTSLAAIKADITTFTGDPGGTQTTNWDLALRSMATANAGLSDKYDLALFLTDGAPNYISNAAGTGGVAVNSYNVTTKSLEQAIFSANQLKAQGTRVVAVGIGDGASGGVSRNLAALSGLTANSDYFQGAWEALGTSIENIVNSAICRVPVTVKKETLNAQNQWTATNGWAMTLGASADVGTATRNGAATQQTAGTAGATPLGEAHWTVDFSRADAVGTLTVSESFVGKPGFGWQSGSYVVHHQNGTETTGSLTGPSNQQISGLSVTDRVEVTFRNAAPARVKATKTWVVKDSAGNTIGTYTQPTTGAAVPQGLTAVPVLGSIANPAWGQEYSGYAQGSELTVDETASVDAALLPGCELTSAKVTSVNGQTTAHALPFAATLGADLNTFVITNTVTCTQTLNLVKAVAAPGLESPSAWLLEASGPAGALPGPKGRYSSTAPVTASVSADTTYTLRESGGPATYVPVAGWQCVLTGTTTEVTVAQSGVRVPLGQDVTCTVTNGTATLTILKQTTEGSGLVPADFTLTGVPAGGYDLPVLQAAGAATATAQNTFEVRPSHTYTLAESTGSATIAYRNLALQKLAVGGDPSVEDDWVDVGSAEIQVSAGEHAIYRFVNDDVPAVVLPLTGGAASDIYLLLGGALMAAFVAFAAWHASRRMKRGHA